MVKRGYGSVQEVEALDTEDFLSAIEYEMINDDIERYELEQARNN